MISNDYIHYLKKMNDQAPEDRLKLLTGTESVLQTCSENLLLAMYTINECIQEKYKTSYYFYIMDDESVLGILEQCGSMNFSLLKREDYEKSLLCLDLAKLLYRFPCAKKFMIENDSIHQLRINSWGRDYVTNHLILKKSQFHADLKAWCMEYFESNNRVYENLVRVLLGPINHKKANYIKSLNENVQLKLLS